MANNPNTQKSPRAEMRDLLRSLVGEKRSGDTEQRRIEIAMRRMNAGGVLGRYALSYRAAYGYWYADEGSTADVPSRHMDRARELAASMAVTDLIAQHERALQAINDNLDRLPCGENGVSVILPVTSAGASALADFFVGEAA